MKFPAFIIFLLITSPLFGQNSCENLKSLLKQGDLEKAEKIILQLTEGPYCDQLFGEFYLRKGRTDKAEEYFEKVLSTADENSLEQASALNGLGLVFWNIGISTKAKEYLLRALSIREELLGKDHELVAASLNDLGLVLSIDDPDAALDYYENALSIYQKIYEPDDQRIAQAKTNIGAAYQNIEFYGDAQANYEEALKIWESIYPDGHPNQGFLLLNLGQTNLTLQNLDAALEFYKQALTVFEKYYGQKHPDVARANRFIGDIYNIQGEYDKALSYYQTALIANAKSFNNQNIDFNPAVSDYISANVLLNCLYYKAEALQGKFYNQTLKFKDLKLALNSLQSGDSLIDKARQLQTSESDKIALGAIASQVYESGVRLCHNMANEAVKKTQYLELSFYFAEKSKSAVLLEAISDASAKSFANIPAIELETEAAFKAEITFLEQKAASSNEQGDIDEYRAKLLTLRGEYSDFVKKLESSYPEYYNLKYNVTIPSVAELQTKLTPGQALISYFLDESNQRIYIFELTESKYNVYNVPQTENFERYMSGFRNSIYFKEETTFDLSAYELYKLLFPKKLGNGSTSLVIIPTGRLGTLPFEALITSNKAKGGYKEKQYLVSQYDISYEYSSTLFYNKKINNIASNKALLCAPVNFERLNNLPATKIEISRLEEILNTQNVTSSVYFEKDANESLFKSDNMQSYKYIHLATHGVVNEFNPELSQIFLNPGPSDDGSLYSGEIYNLKIKADLVTLSACETGLGKISKGEGIIGLSRALVYSGANNIVVSLWSVADQSTSNLMIDFYGDINKGSYSAALRSSKLKMIQTSEYSEPFYWAPFILIGK